MAFDPYTPAEAAELKALGFELGSNGASRNVRKPGGAGIILWPREHGTWEACVYGSHVGSEKVMLTLPDVLAAARWALVEASNGSA